VYGVYVFMCTCLCVCVGERVCVRERGPEALTLDAEYVKAITLC